MSSTRRLPVVGVAPEDDDTIVLGPRPRCPVRAIAVLAARDGIAVEAFVGALVDAAREASIVVREGDEPRGDACELLVGGAELARAYEPWLVVVVDAGLPLASWSAIPRALALAGAVDLVLAEPRESVARGLGRG